MTVKRHVRFGIIGLGSMGREFAGAVGRWCHLLDLDFAPRITAICNRSEGKFDWYTSHFDSIEVATTDYREMLESGKVDAIYCSVPHHLHASMYTDIIQAGIHLLGEKPFGIDLQANQQILATLSEHPEVFAACSSQFAFYPGAQRVFRYMQDNPFGQIIEIEAGFLHSSDLNPNKPINWKRTVHTNGEYGAMGDLGLHILYLPLRAGWMPNSVYARLSNIMPVRLDAEGKKVPSDTWDNAILNCEIESEQESFPMTLKMYRIAPGETNTWYVRVLGTEFSVAYSSKFPKTLQIMRYAPGDEQAWQFIDLGHHSAYPTITGGLFEFGEDDALLQMVAAFCEELVVGRENMKQALYCVTPPETNSHHRLLTAALDSQQRRQVIQI